MSQSIELRPSFLLRSLCNKAIFRVSFFNLISPKFFLKFSLVPTLGFRYAFRSKTGFGVEPSVIDQAVMDMF